jgi:hypothetical protein
MGSRRILGFALGENHNAELAYQALVMAVTVRGGRDAIAGMIMHSDYAEVGVKPRSRQLAWAAGVV